MHQCKHDPKTVRTNSKGGAWGRVLAVLWTFAIWLLAWQAYVPAAPPRLPEADVPGGYCLTGGELADGRTQEQRGIVWLDNQRAMFQGYIPMEGRQKGDVGVYIWNVERNEVLRYGEEVRFCYADGTIYLWELSKWARPPTGMEPNSFTQRYRYGPLGKEKPGICRGDGLGHNEGCVGDVDMSCKPWVYARGASPLGVESRVEVHLRSGDGVIVARSAWAIVKRRNVPYEELVRLSRQPLLLVNERHPQGKPLPMQEVEEIGAGRAAYSDFKQKYVLVGASPKNGRPGHFTNWPAGMPQPVYSMSRDGEVEVIEMPKLKDWTNIHQAMPSRQGLVYWGSHGRTGGGLFIYNGTRNDAIDRGQVGTFAVSPDGCKVAYAIINDYNRGPSPPIFDYRIKYVNLCRGD